MKTFLTAFQGDKKLVKFLKRQIKDRFPKIVSAYHSYIGRKQYKKMQTKMNPLGFKFKGIDAIHEGNFEKEETKFLLDTLGKTDVFVDIGANVGYFSCIALHKGVKTIMVEPLVENLSILYENLIMNGWYDFEVFPVGLAEKPGIADLYGLGTGASILKRWAGTSELVKHTIPLATLDNLLGERFSKKRLLIKIDVEGAEYDVLKGSLATIGKNPKPTWLIEICLTENQPHGLNPNFQNTFDLFWRNGYTVFSLEDNYRVVTPGDVQRWVDNRSRDFGYVNYLFIESNT